MAIEKLPDYSTEEGSSIQVSGPLQDFDGEDIPASAVSVLTLTIINDADETAILEDEDISSGVTDGAWMWVLTDENTIVGSSVPVHAEEVHRALVHLETSSGYKKNQEFLIRVKNLKTVS